MKRLWSTQKLSEHWALSPEDLALIVGIHPDTLKRFRRRAAGETAWELKVEHLRK